MTSSESAGRWDAGLYDDAHSFVWKYGEALVDLLAPAPGERILDLGCGTGHLTARIAALGASVVGFDSSAEMIEQARRAYPDLQFELADARTFALGSDFDAVFSNAALHWVKQPEAAIVQIGAALKTGGRFVAEMGGKGNTRVMMAALRRQFAKFGVVDIEIPWYFPGISEYSALLEQNGFEVTLATLFDRPTPLEGEDGLRNWLAMFGSSLTHRLSPADRESFLHGVADELRPKLYQENRWIADYRRLRIVARRDG